MITQVFGGPGVGKTAFLTAQALEYLTGEGYYEDKFTAKREIENLNLSGYNFTIPPHMVFANYPISCRYSKRKSQIISGFALGFKQKQHKTQLMPPCARIFIDEAQEVYNSRESKKFPWFVSRFYEKHRHYDLEIMLASQRHKLIDINIRELSQRHIFIIKMEHKYCKKLDTLERTTWHYLEFDNNASAEAYIASGEKSADCTKGKFTFEGDIFDFYNHKWCRPMFLKGAAEKDFSLLECKELGIDPASVEEFNSIYNMEIPDTFYGLKEEKKKK